MICLVCRQAELVDGLASFVFEQEETKIVINRIPARICRGCREAYVDENVAVKLLQGLDRMTKAGILDGASEYDLL